MLGSEESLFKNEDALDYEFVPKLLPYREQQQRTIAAGIKPLLQGRTGRNFFIFGAPGIGKTAATRWVLRDLEEQTEEVYTLYVNCWQKNTSYKILVELCQQLGYQFTQNKNVDDLLNIVKNIVNKKMAVIVLDEADKLQELDIVYNLLNELYKKTVVLITNYKEWHSKLEPRITSRLQAEEIEFQTYNYSETAGILKHRTEYAFVANTWEEEAMQTVVKQAFEMKDIRAGIYLLREAGRIAEEQSSKKVLTEHAQKAVEKLPEFSPNMPDKLDSVAQEILEMVKNNSGKKIGDLYLLYREKNKDIIYKTFQRRVEQLERGKFIETTKVVGGKEGTTTILHSINEKKITEYG